MEIFNTEDSFFDCNKIKCSNGTYLHILGEVTYLWSEEEKRWAGSKNCLRDGCLFKIGYGSLFDWERCDYDINWRHNFINAIVKGQEIVTCIKCGMSGTPPKGMIDIDLSKII